MPEIPDAPSEFDDPSFVQTVMYHGRSSRRPGLRLLFGVAFGLAVAASGVVLYADLAQWEAAGRPERMMQVSLVALYEIGGKGLVLALFLGGGLCILAVAARSFLTDRRAARAQTRSPDTSTAG